MRHLLQFVRPSRAARRLVVTRRGSVLILCVVLIVVLALIGTAMLSGARIDRYATQQHGTNTQIEMLVEGARQIAQGAVVNDLFDGQSGAFRRAAEQSQLNPSTTYDHSDAHYFPPLPGGGGAPAANDAFLASLAPRRLPGGQIVWDAITGPLASASFESPLRGPGTALDSRNYMVPTARVINYPDGTSQSFPALQPIDPATGAAGAIDLAADADGDGIADAMLSRLLPGELNGVTWYMAARVVDNAAKVNVNTAMSRQADFNATGTPLPADQITRYFTGSVGLAEMLRTWNPAPGAQLQAMGTELLTLNQHRFGMMPFPHGITGGPGEPVADPVSPSPAPSLRTDFEFLGINDAMYMGLGRRLDNPGWIGPAEANRWQAYGVNDMTALLAGFTLISPEASRTPLEEALNDSIYDGAANGANSPRKGMRRYAPGDVNTWFTDSFDFDAEVLIPTPAPATFKPLRALLATRNPVTNWAPVHSMDLPAPLGVDANNKVDFDDQLMGTSWNLMPNYGTSPTQPGGRSVAKTDVNTAKFGELWRAYWNVMVDQHLGDAPAGGARQGTPFSVPAGTFSDYAVLTWKGNGFDQGTHAPHSGLGNEHPQHMFRSSIRDFRPATPLHFSPAQQMLLRAALAAVNTEDMRDPDDTPTRRDIDLSVTDASAGAGIPARVSVYGIERQPYITEVYVNTDNQPTSFPGGANPKGYVAIELYNPYSEPIPIGDWSLAVIDRRTTGSSHPATGGPGLKGLSYFYIHAGPADTLDTSNPAAPPTPPWRFPTGLEVPAKGFLILHNVDPSGADIEAARAPPPNVNVVGPTQYVPNLHWVVQDVTSAFKESRGGELVLLRSLATPPTPLLTSQNTVPVDSFDFTGLNHPEFFGLGSEQYFAWHYMRSNSASAAAPAEPNWKFVYPGRYQGDLPFGHRHQGTREPTPWIPGAGGDTVAVNLGVPSAMPFQPTIHTIQMNALDFPGLFPPNIPGATDNRYPFGGFARNGDILQVPFIGSYRVSFNDDNLSFLELNAVTIDSCFANDSDLANDEMAGDTEVQSREQVGRFAPIHDRDATAPFDANYDDLDPVGDFNATSLVGTNKWRYRWAIDLFEYLTVQSPGNDYLPSVPTVDPPGTAYAPARLPVNNVKGKAAGGVDTSPPAPPQAPGAEDAVPLHGLININTAPAKVLAALPWMPMGDTMHYDEATRTWIAGADPTGLPVEDNYELAKEIVLWRDGGATAAQPANGPFTSLFDLYRVPAFHALNKKLVLDTLATGGPNDADGDFSPHNTPRPPATPPPLPGVDAVRYDFEEQFLLLNKVSNLITTRSDSFTVYVTVQGWTNVGKPTTPPQLVAQRRVAFIIDRSGVRVSGGQPDASEVVITPVPTD